MAIPRNQLALEQYCRDRLGDAIRRAEEVTRNREEEALMRPRHDGGWSIAEVLTHVAGLNQSYIRPMERAAYQAQPSTTPNPSWRPSLAGRLLSWSVRTPRRLKTARMWQPERPRASAASLQQFVESQQALIDLLERSRLLHWQRIRVSSPAASFIRLNIGDCFRVLAEHAERHIREVESRAIHP